jgi:hypothetical protein
VHPIVVVKAPHGDSYWRGADELLLVEPSAVVPRSKRRAPALGHPRGGRRVFLMEPKMCLRPCMMHVGIYRYMGMAATMWPCIIVGCAAARLR